MSHAEDGVTLVGGTGSPNWFRCICGGAKTQTALAVDKTFSIHTRGVALIELLPDPQADGYRFRSEVRHEDGDRMSEVGVYVGRTAHPSEVAEIQFFTRVTFNDVRSTHQPPRLAPHLVVPPKRNAVAVRPHLHSEEGLPPNIDWVMDGVAGPEFDHAGEGAAGWRALDLTVTPAGVSGTWDGQAISITRAHIEASAATTVQRMKPMFSSDHSAQGWRGNFAPRGARTIPLRSVRFLPQCIRRADFPERLIVFS